MKFFQGNRGFFLKLKKDTFFLPIRKYCLPIFIAVCFSFFLLVNLSNDIPTTKIPNGIKGEEISGLINLEVYIAQKPELNKELSKSILSGLLWDLQNMPSKNFINLCIFLIAIGVLSSISALKYSHPRVIIVFLTFCIVISILLSIRLSQGWDEFFINLKHSYNLSQFGVFSVNKSQHIEGTVDFLPFIMIGLLNRFFNFPLIETTLFFSLFGNILIIIFTYLSVKKLTKAIFPAVFSTLFVSVFPPVLYVGASGFMATLFSGFFLMSFYLIILKKGKWTVRGYFLLGLLSLMRTEAILFALLFLFLHVFIKALKIILLSPPYKRKIFLVTKIVLFYLFIVICPFLLLSLFRYIYFGHAIPNPITFKNTSGDFDYLRVGFKQAVEVVRKFQFDKLFIILGPSLIWFITRQKPKIFAYLIAITFFTLTYFSGGGDWFPQTWSRYSLPFMVIFIILIIASLYVHLQNIFKRIYNISFIIILLLISLVVSTTGSASNVYIDTFHDLKYSGERWNRINKLSDFGNFLNKTIPESSKVGSPEVATIMYFAKRDVVDLLGVSNIGIAKSPLNPLFPGDIMHRKRNPLILKEDSPGILALYEMTFDKPIEINSLDMNVIQKFVQSSAFNQSMVDIGYYRAGSYDYLINIGYHPFVVINGPSIYVYWVHDNILSAHRVSLGIQEFKNIGSISVPYKVSEVITSKFSSGLSAIKFNYNELNNTKIEKPIEGTKVELSKGWSLNGQYPDFKPPTSISPVYGSWNGSDANTGTITFGPISLQTGHIIEIPIISGPNTKGQKLKIIDASNNKILNEINIQPPDIHKWFGLRISLPEDIGSKGIFLVGADEGKDSGQWFGMGLPCLIK